MLCLFSLQQLEHQMPGIAVSGVRTPSSGSLPCLYEVVARSYMLFILHSNWATLLSEQIRVVCIFQEPVPAVRIMLRYGL